MHGSHHTRGKASRVVVHYSRNQETEEHY